MPAFLRLTGLVLIALGLILTADATKNRAPSDSSCKTNAECIRAGQPLLRPRVRTADTVPHDRRQNTGQAFVPVQTSSCGTAQEVFLPTGTYQVQLNGAAGGGDGRGIYKNRGGLGATSPAEFVVSRNITIGYFVGCAGIQNAGSGGGGGSFMYYLGPGEWQSGGSRSTT
jgi:hypothetical protein